MASELPEIMDGQAPEEQSPLFRLPREIRDNIYDLVALSEGHLHLRVVLKRGSKPQKRAFAADAFVRTSSQYKSERNGLDRTSSQLRQEYKEALERRIKLLMTTRDLAGNRLETPARRQQADVPARVHVSQLKHADGSITQSAQVLTIPLLWEGARWVSLEVRQSLVVHFAIDESEAQGVRNCIAGPLACVSHDATKVLFNWPRDAVPALKQIIGTAKATDWKGAFGLYAFWHNYVLRFMRKEDLRE